MPPDQSISGATSLSLLERARKNDAEAWPRLIQLYSPLVYHWCRRSGFDEHEAADILQEVFHSVSRSLVRFDHRGAGAFRGWLRTITANNIRNRIRKEVPVAEGGSTAQSRWQDLPVNLPEDNSDFDSRRELVRRALQLIRGDFQPTTWQAFEQVILEQKPAGEVAETLKLSLGAVFQARARVLHRLREELGESLDDLLSRER